MHEFVLVRRDMLSEDAQVRLAVPLLNVAKDLIVSAVFLDNIYDMVKDTRFPNPFRHTAAPDAGLASLCLWRLEPGDHDLPQG